VDKTGTSLEAEHAKVIADITAQLDAQEARFAHNNEEDADLSSDEVCSPGGQREGAGEEEHKGRGRSRREGRTEDEGEEV